MDQETPDRVDVASGVAKDGRPFVHLTWGEKVAQWTVDDARQFAGQCLAVAEAAEHDALVYAWLGDRLGVSGWAQRAEIINDLRQYRQDTSTSALTLDDVERAPGTG